MPRRAWPAASSGMPSWRFLSARDLAAAQRHRAKQWADSTSSDMAALAAMPFMAMSLRASHSASLLSVLTLRPPPKKVPSHACGNSAICC